MRTEEMAGEMSEESTALISHRLQSPTSSPTSIGFNTNQLSFNSRTSGNYSDYDDNEAVVDPNIIRDELEEGDDDEMEG
ncbi:hypothetical protein L2E82_12384 [Cichorium intybus]|uniref:Uncharacterized protein n=1 Tax=Cichorium intybus TaxID=13427 RepID=A0ACB9GFN9_CICIN|nr:hypothetical protein L2E82_12384 [Cichorium intybus]